MLFYYFILNTKRFVRMVDVIYRRSTTVCTGWHETSEAPGLVIVVLIIPNRWHRLTYAFSRKEPEVLMLFA